jgi:hypothetical protein
MSKLKHALLTLEMLRTRECTPTPYSFVVSIFAFESFKEFGGVSYKVNDPPPKAYLRPITFDP